MCLIVCVCEGLMGECRERERGRERERERESICTCGFNCLYSDLFIFSFHSQQSNVPNTVPTSTCNLYHLHSGWTTTSIAYRRHGVRISIQIHWLQSCPVRSTHSATCNFRQGFVSTETDKEVGLSRLVPSPFLGERGRERGRERERPVLRRSQSVRG